MAALPPELEYTILRHYITRRDRPLNFVHLVFVAKRFQEWIEPLLYHTLCESESKLSWHKKYPPIMQEGYELSTAFLRNAHHTRNLLLQGIPTSRANRILTHCTGCDNLSLWLLSGPYSPLLATIRTRIPNLLHLSVKADKLFEPDPYDASLPLSHYNHDTDFRFDHTAFPKLTHLDIINIEWTHASFDTHWSSMSLLPDLTHVAIDGAYKINDAFVVEMLQRCPQITLLCLSRTLTDMSVSQKFPQIVYLPSLGTPMKQWERSVKGSKRYDWSKMGMMLVRHREGVEPSMRDSSVWVTELVVSMHGSDTEDGE